MNPSVSQNCSLAQRGPSRSLLKTNVEECEQSLAAARSCSAALIIADADLCHFSFSDGIATLGRRSITVRLPLEAILSLQDDSPQIGVVLAPAHDPRFRAMEFFAFMRDAYPLVRRIAYTKRALEHSRALVVFEPDFP